MEGPLSKWTNMVHGWQYRWFKLEHDALVYFTSRDKMLKGQQRGCMRLNGAIVGIDGENNSLFTLTSEGKIFHLQGRDERERNQWVRALESSIREVSGYRKETKTKEETTVDSLKSKIVEADQHLTSLISQVKELEFVKERGSEKDQKTLESLIVSGTALLDTVKHAIILLQMARNKIEIPPEDNLLNNQGNKSEPNSMSPPSSKTTKQLDETNISVASPRPAISSDDEEFYDADEELLDLDTVQEESERPIGTNMNTSPVSFEEEETFDFGDSHENFDEIYDNAEEHDIGNVQQEHGSVLMHLLSQVSVGMDLTKVTLPTFILERRSLLEMYADFFAHPDAFVATVNLDTPEKRFISVVRYYLNAFYAARKSGVAKKPYNPILGESFRCRYNVPGMELSGNKTEAGPFPGSDENQLTFIAEQVSHHPPISAFYAEHPGKRISFHAHIYTKSSFLGLSIGVANIGSGTVILHDYDEHYTVTFPSGYGRSIMSTPWVELGGKVKVTCEKTGFYADIEFLTKPFFGGKPHKIQGNIFRDGAKKPLLVIRGEWNGVMYAKPQNGEEYVFIDVKSEQEMKKECVPVMQQGERESRRLWRHVTCALLRNRIQVATTAKRMIEQRQRAEAKERLERGEKWNTRYFSLASDERWLFDDKLDKRCHEYMPFKMIRKEFSVSACNSDFNSYVILMDGCIFVWIGKSDINSFNLAHYPTSSSLIEGPGANSICMKSFNSSIAKIFQEKQVFVSSDIEEEEPRFWQILFTAIKPQLEQLITFKNTEAMQRLVPWNITSMATRFHSKLPRKSTEQILKEKTPKGVLDRNAKDDPKPYEDPALPKHPGGINSVTGEVGGPAGPEPTRYGDWERKGRVSDF